MSDKPIKHPVNFIDMTGQQYGNWKVLEYVGDTYGKGKWLCECQCEKHTKRVLRGVDIRSGQTSNCGCIRNEKLSERNASGREKLEGTHIREWDVLEYVGNKHYLCRCSCGKEKIVSARGLKLGTSKSCGHNNGKATFDDLTGRTFGKWYVLEYVGDKYYKCQCKCGTITNVTRNNLLKGDSTQCINCRTKQLMSNTLTKIKSSGIYNKERTEEQLYATESRENIVAFLSKHELINAPTYKVAEELGVCNAIALKYIHRFNIESYIDFGGNGYEHQVRECLKQRYSLLDTDMIIHDRQTITPNELDIYIPEKKLAIEFNGTYWHSTATISNKHYHQNKTIECAKRGIRLIHIFEYEWKNEVTKNKILNILDSIMNDNKEIVYARNTVVKSITSEEAQQFLEKYHLQGAINSEVNIGCLYRNELIGVMTFGKPRFNSNYEWELHRMCWKPDKIITGGLEKMFSYFKKTFNPQSIITYCDIAKFTGNSYYKMNFKLIQPNPITEPNYVWVLQRDNLILSRYQTMKQKLLDQGLGTKDQTENEIMESLNFLKVYDSGNIKLEWKK